MFNLALLLLLTLPLTSCSFAPTTRIIITSSRLVSSSSSSSLKAAPPKRRRRKTAVPTTPTSPSSDDDDDYELPDFENDDDYEDDSSGSSTVAASNIIPRRTSTSTNIIVSKDAIARRGSRSGVGLDPKLAEEVGGNVDGLDSEIILDAMRGKSSSSTTSSEGGWQPPRSLRDTINDRSLEKYMNFDRMIERDGGGTTSNDNNKASVVKKVELPDFDEVINRRRQREAMQEGGRRSAEVDPAAKAKLLLPIDTSKMGKKAARDAERRALAMQRTKDEESSSSSGGQQRRNEWIASLFTDLNIVKVTENGAWIGIGLLVVWEIYINSPFFDRAAPLIPVVYDTLPPGMG